VRQAAQWLETSDARAQDGTIDYVGCLLVHDPNRGSRDASHTVANHLYEVRPSRELAVID